jgi:hypothetical protein
MKYRSKCGVAAVITLSIASCAAPPQSAEPVHSASPASQPEMPTGLLKSAGGKKAVVHAGQSSAPKEDGQLNGSLASDGAGCIILRAPDGETTTLVFPQGTTFKGESLALPDGASITDGNTVTLDGARVPANEDLSMCTNYHRLFSVEKASAQT